VLSSASTQRKATTLVMSQGGILVRKLETQLSNRQDGEFRSAYITLRASSGSRPVMTRSNHTFYCVQPYGKDASLGMRQIHVPCKVAFYAHYIPRFPLVSNGS
jgi:hypothetical protein